MADIILGTDMTTNKPVTIDNKDRVRGTYVIGRTGFGKSIMLEQLAVQDSEKGYGFCFLDPHGDVLDHILCRMPQERIDKGDVILLDAADYTHPFGLNLYECHASDPLTMRQTFNQVEQVFAKVFGMSKETPRLSQFVRNITATLLANQGYTMCEIPMLLQDEQFRTRMVANLMTGSPARLFWKAYDALRPLERLDRAESTLDRIDALINNDILRYIVGQSKTTINFQEIMNTGKVLLVKLPGHDEDITTLLGSVIINQLLLAALSRKNIPEKKRRQFNIYADEFQRFAIPSFGQLLIEARKYRIATICANQVLNDLGEQLRPRMLNAGCLVVFNVQDEDATDLAGEFNYTPPQAVKPKPVIPSNVLDHLNRHQNQTVRDFYSNFVMHLEAAAKQREEYETTDNRRIAHYDFGEGSYQYDINKVPKVLSWLNILLREALEKNQVNTELKFEILRFIAPWLGFSTYYNVHYVSAPKSDPQGVEKELQTLNEKIADCEAYIASDQAFLAFLAQSGYTSKAESERGSARWSIERGLEFLGERVQRDFSLTDLSGKTPDTVWESMKKQAKENAALATINTFDKIIAIKRAEIQSELARVKKRREELVRKLAPFKYAKEAGKKRSMTDKRLHYIMLDGKIWRASTYRPRLLSSRYTPSLLSLPYTGIATTDMTNVVCYSDEDEWNDCRYYGLYGSPLIELCETLVGYERKIPYIEAHLANDTWVAGYRSGYKESYHDDPTLLQRIAEACTQLATLTTPEQILAANKDAYAQSEIPPLKVRREQLIKKLEFHKRGIGAEIELFADQKYRYFHHAVRDFHKERAETIYAEEQIHCDHYAGWIDKILHILMTPEGKVFVPSTQWQETVLVQQTHTDKRSEIANALTHLPVGQAWVRLTTSNGERKIIVEHVIDTTMPSGMSEKELEKKRTQVVEFTRRNYCKTRQEVEKEIQQRQNRDNHLPIKRRGA